jgi:hypothetical protein
VRCSPLIDSVGGPRACIGTINHLFSHSEKYQVDSSGPRGEPGAPCTNPAPSGIFAGTAAAQAANNPR